jgi:hypothetical protein
VILAKPRASARFPRTVDAKKVLGIGGDPLPMLVESTSMRRDVLPYFFHVPKVYRTPFIEHRFNNIYIYVCVSIVYPLI